MQHRSKILPSTLLVGVIISAIGCTGTPNSPADNGQPVSARPLPEADSVRFYSGMTMRERLVIRDNSTWTSVWQQLTTIFLPPPGVPVIDFASNAVIVAAMGTKSTGGYSIDVDDVRNVAGDLEVSITEQSPGSGCVVTEALTAPAAIVVVPQFAGQATFLEHTSQVACR